MRRGWKASQVSADFGNQCLSGASAYARNGVQVPQRRLERAQPLGHLRTHPLDQLVQRVEMRQLLCEQEALVDPDTASEGALQLRQLVAELAFGQLRECRRIAATRRQCGQHL